MRLQYRLATDAACRTEQMLTNLRNGQLTMHMPPETFSPTARLNAEQDTC